MPVSLDNFRSLAASGALGTRAVLLNTGNAHGDGVVLGRLGRCTVCQVQRDANNATMAAFKEALEQNYGAVGADAFSSVLGLRLMQSHALRIKDVKQVFGRLQELQKASVKGEVARQAETHPRLVGLSGERRTAVVSLAQEKALAVLRSENAHTEEPPIGGFRFRSADRLAQTVETAIGAALTELGETGAAAPAPAAPAAEGNAGIPAGLRLLSGSKTDFGRDATSVEDRFSAGHLSRGMRINYGSDRPMLFEKLKTNGVEPGFICRRDWSADDTASMMAGTDAYDPTVADSPERDVLFRQAWALAAKGSKLDAALNDYRYSSWQVTHLFADNPQQSAFLHERMRRDLCFIGCSVGTQHPASMAFATQYVLRSLMEVSAEGRARAPGHDVWTAFASAESLTPELRSLQDVLGSHRPEEFFATGTAARTPEQREALKTFVGENFVRIRDAVMHLPKDSEPGSLPAFRRFADRHIVKLDYNEGDRALLARSARGSGGLMKLPRRVDATHNVFYRMGRLTSATAASAGAVAEALANDLTRLAGVPTQELSVTRGEYSDGRTKLMLDAKFATGYCDFDGVFLKDGRLTAAVGGSGKTETPEDIGRYKAAFLLLADRDAIGSHGQNKGLVNGKFFAIDPGHSLEGRGKQLELHDDFSFRYTGQHNYFRNYSVFDDSTRFEKFKGILELDSMRSEGKADDLFDAYEDMFSAEKMTGPDEELGKSVRKRVAEMRTEFNGQLSRMLDEVFKPQLDFYKAIEERNGLTPKSKDNISAKKAINTIENLEKETSPVTERSKNGEVHLKHLEVVSGKRTAWTARMEGGALVYESQGAVPDEARARLTELISSHTLLPVHIDSATGKMRITVPFGQEKQFFELMSEKNVRQRKYDAAMQ